MVARNNNSFDHPYLQGFSRTKNHDKGGHARQQSKGHHSSYKTTVELVPVEICRDIPVYADVPPIQNNGHVVKSPQFGNFSQIFMGILGGVVVGNSG